MLVWMLVSVLWLNMGSVLGNMRLTYPPSPPSLPPSRPVQPGARRHPGGNGLLPRRAASSYRRRQARAQIPVHDL
jgi:hypothetical protein